MRIALISDIHGHLVALDAVLADIDCASIDRVICLGDVAADGPRPRETLQRLRDRAIPVVKGNADNILLQPIAARPTRSAAPWTGPIADWSAAQLTDDDRRYVDAFPESIEVSLGPAGTLHCYHGSPRSWSDNILPATPASDVEAWLAPLAGLDSSICAGGHTHEPMLRRLAERLVINPGSVGAPFDRTLLAHTFRIFPWADYAILDTAGAHTAITFARVPLDLAAVATDARASNMPHVEGWLGMYGL